MSSSVSIYMIQMHEQSWTYVSENAPCASSEGICWGMILAVENFGSLQERWWQSVGMGACPIFRRKSSWFGFFWKGVEQCWTSTGPKTWVFLWFGGGFWASVGWAESGWFREAGNLTILCWGRSRTMYLVAYYGYFNLYEYSYIMDIYIYRYDMIFLWYLHDIFKFWWLSVLHPGRASDAAARRHHLSATGAAWDSNGTWPRGDSGSRGPGRLETSRGMTT